MLGAIIVALRQPYINESDCKVLAKYQYHTAAGTKLDNILNRYWWSPLSNYIPLNIHPNALTVAGLAISYIVAFFPLVFCVPTFDSECSRWIYLLTATGLFLYQTLDALDGKQARRTGLSAPTGQMMDHGCDSLTTFLAIFIVYATCQLGTGPMIALQLACVTSQLFFYSWYECTYGIFRACTGEYFGVTEGQWMIILVNIIAFIDPSFWRRSVNQAIPGFWGSLLGVFTLGLSFGTLLYLLTIPLFLYMAYKDFHEVLTTRLPPNVNRAVKEWLQLGLHVYCNVALVLGGVLNRQPQLTVLLIAISSSLVAWRLIMSCVSKAKLRLIQWPSLPFYATAILTSCRFFGPSIEAGILVGTGAWMCLALFMFIQVNMTIIRDYLGLNLFAVPASQRHQLQEILPSKKIFTETVNQTDFVSPSAKTDLPRSETPISSVSG